MKMKKTRLMKTFVTLMLTAAMTVASVLPLFAADEFASEIISEDCEFEPGDELMLTDGEEAEPADESPEAGEAAETGPDDELQDADIAAPDEEPPEEDASADDAPAGYSSEDDADAEEEPDGDRLMGDAGQYGPLVNPAPGPDASKYRLIFSAAEGKFPFHLAVGSEAAWEDICASFGDAYSYLSQPAAIEKNEDGAFSVYQKEDGSWYVGADGQLSGDGWMKVTSEDGTVTEITVTGRDVEKMCGDNLTWKLDNGYKIRITGTGDMWDYERAEDSPFREIPTDLIIYLVFSDEMTSIGSRAFEGMSSLRRFMPESEETINPYSSGYCFTGGLTRIGDAAFKNCNAIGFRVEIGEALEYIGEDAFLGDDWTLAPKDECQFENGISPDNRFFVCDGQALYDKDMTRLLSYIGDSKSDYVIPASVRRIDYEAFGWFREFNNYSPHYIRFEDPANLRYVGFEAFGNAHNLKFCLSGTDDLTLSYVGEYAFANCPFFEGTVTLDENVTEVPEHAFSGCSGLKEVTIESPDIVIGENAFSGCSGLKELTIESSDIVIGENAFKGCSGLEEFYTESPIKGIEKHVFDGCTSLESVIMLDESITDIPDYAFAGCESLSCFDMPSPLKSVGAHAFDGFHSDTGTINLSKDFTIVLECSFNDCSGITISIPEGMELNSIGEKAFCNCPALTGDLTINIKNRLVGLYYDGHTFEGCTGLTSLTVLSNTPIYERSFAGCTGLKTVSIYHRSCSIGDYGFAGCTGLTDLFINPETWRTSIGKGAFSGCTQLKNVTLPEVALEIGDGAFKDCPAIEDLVMPRVQEGDNELTVPAESFSGCTALKSSKILNGTTVIKTSAYENCSSLSSIRIPVTVTEIHDNAFKGCTQLSEIYYGGTMDQWNSINISLTGNEALKNPDLTVHTDPDYPSYGTVKTIITGNGTVTFSDSEYTQYNIAKMNVYPGDGNTITSMRLEDSLGNECSVCNSGYDGYDYCFYFSGEYMVLYVEFGPQEIEPGTEDSPCRLTQDHFTYFLETGWYEVSEDITVYSPIRVTGDVHLILGEGTTLNAKSSIVVPESSSLTISGKGTVNAYGTVRTPAIGGVYRNPNGMIVIEDGTVNAYGDYGGAAIGGGGNRTCGKIIINGGTVFAKGDQLNFGIGAGLRTSGSDGGEITINGGTVTAIAANAEKAGTNATLPAGIGGKGCSITINGGTIKAISTGQDDDRIGSAIGNDEHLADCTITIADHLKVTSGNEKTPALYDDRVEACKNDIVDIVPCPHDGGCKEIDGKTFCPYCHERIAAYEAPDANTGLVYTGQSQALISAGSVTDGAMFYAVTMRNTAPSDELYAETVPEATDAGTYYVWYRTEGNGEGTATAISNVQVTIDKAVYEGKKEAESFVICENTMEPVSVRLPAIPAGAAYDGRTIRVSDPDGLINGTVSVSGTEMTFNTNVKDGGTKARVTLRVRNAKNYKDYNMTVTVTAREDMMWIDDIPDQDYTGSAIKPPVTVHFKDKILSEKDYTVTYKNNTNAAPSDAVNPKTGAGIAPTVTVKGKGNYAGTATETFTIKPLDIAGADAPDMIFAHDGRKAQYGKTKVTYVLNGKSVTLKENKDFTYEFEAGKDYQTAGSYKTKITGIGNYCGEKKYTQTIAGADQTLLAKVTVPKIPDQTYTGKKFILKTGEGQTANADEMFAVAKKGNAQEDFLFELKNGTVPLTPGEDYTLSYSDNKEAGTATVTIRAAEKENCRYAGSRTLTFSIKGTALSSYRMERMQDFVWDGTEKKQADQMFYTGTGDDKQYLTEDADYTVSYSGSTVDAGTVTVTYTGINGNTGTVKKTYKIAPYSLKEDNGKRITVTMDGPYPYTKGGTEARPAAVRYVLKDGEDTIAERTLTEGADYTLKWSGNNAVTAGGAAKKPSVTITGKGNFTGSCTAEFTIIGSELSGGTVSVGTKDVTYALKPGICKTAVTVTDKTTGAKLAAGTDYEKEVSYTYAAATRIKDSAKPVKDGNRIIDYETEAEDRAAGSPVLAGDIIPAGTEIKVTVTGKGAYRGSGENPGTATGSFFIIDKAYDLSKAKITIRPMPYTGNRIELTSADITFVIGGTEVPLVLGTDYEIIEDPKSNFTDKGTHKLTVKGIGNGYGFSKAASLTITARSLDYTLSYDANSGGLIDALAQSMFEKDKAEHDGTADKTLEQHREYCAANYLVNGTMKTTVTPYEGKLPKCTLKVQKKSEKNGKVTWTNVPAAEISFSRWSRNRDGSGQIFADGGMFRPSWWTKLLYGDRLTLYAQWDVK